MKAVITLLVIILAIYTARAEVEQAESAEQVRKFLQDNKDGTVALFFIDSSHQEGAEGGFWNGIVGSISHIFSGEDEADANGTKPSSIELNDIAPDAKLIQIDVSNEDLRDIQESYDVTTVPFIIVFKRGIVVLKEVPTHETHDKILQVLNVNPAGEHEEETPAEPEKTEDTAEHPDHEPAEVATPEPTPAPEEQKHITLAPGDHERARPAERPTPASSTTPTPSDNRRKQVRHTWRDVTTYDDSVAANWRNSPYYIRELEDYEIPEDWWRNGYSPIYPPTPEPKPAPPAPEPQTKREPIVIENVPEPYLAPRPVVVEAPVVETVNYPRYPGYRPAVVERPAPVVTERVAPVVTERIAPGPVVAERFGGPVVAEAPTGSRVVTVREVPTRGAEVTGTRVSAAPVSTTSARTAVPTTTKTSSTKPVTTTKPATTTKKTTTTATPTKTTTRPVSHTGSSGAAKPAKTTHRR